VAKFSEFQVNNESSITHSLWKFQAEIAKERSDFRLAFEVLLYRVLDHHIEFILYLFW
jgi:hypothetical protein